MTDKLTPIEVRLSYDLADENNGRTGQQRRRGKNNGRGSRGPPLRPVVRPQPGNRDSDFTMISRNCGDDDVCVPDVRLETAL